VESTIHGPSVTTIWSGLFVLPAPIAAARFDIEDLEHAPVLAAVPGGPRWPLGRVVLDLPGAGGDVQIESGVDVAEVVPGELTDASQAVAQGAAVDQ
jgi:hypothetical protein